MEVVPDVPDWLGDGGGGEDDNEVEHEDGYYQSIHAEGETSHQGNATPFKMF